MNQFQKQIINFVNKSRIHLSSLMFQKLSREPSTKNCTQQINSSRKAKCIKQIRIIDNEKQNSFTNIPASQNQNSCRKTFHQHPFPQEFSFKKQAPPKQQKLHSNKLNILNEGIISLEQNIRNQQTQIRKLGRMLASMQKKVQTQKQEHEQILDQYEEFYQEQKSNQDLKRQILELKELMKELLLEKQTEKLNFFH